jgi:hypothetical protein
MSPYDNPLEHIKDVSSYFKDIKDGSKVFIGQSLELRIPKSFSKHGMLLVGDEVTTLGIMDMIFDDKYHVGLNILGQITIRPSDMGQMTYNGVDYLVLHLKNGDTFMTTNTILQNQQVVYVLWVEFFTSGNNPYWMDYEATLSIFKHVVEMTGSGIGVSRSVFEGIVSHIARDPDDIAVKYRLTDMKKPMKLVALKSISMATENTSSKLIGAYFRDEGLTSALRREVDQQQPFENILRGISTSVYEPKDDAVL